jgi:hypothetical protein
LLKGLNSTPIEITDLAVETIPDASLEFMVLRGPLDQNIERHRRFELQASARGGDVFEQRHGARPLAVGVPPRGFHHVSAYYAGFVSAFLHAHHIG